MQPGRSLPSLNDVLIAIIQSDDDNRLCSGMGRIDSYALHPEEVRGYGNRLVLPCGDEGHLVKVFITEDGETKVLWVH